MKLHERYFIAAKARNEIDKAVLDTISRHELTYGELLNILGQLVLTWSAYLVKDERQENAESRSEGPADSEPAGAQSLDEVNKPAASTEFHTTD